MSALQHFGQLAVAVLLMLLQSFRPNTYALPAIPFMRGHSLDLLVDGCLAHVHKVDTRKGLHLRVGLVNHSKLALDLLA
jgi:hypothetical protein